MLKNRILIIMSLLMLVASFQSANAGLGSILSGKTNQHYSTMLSQNIESSCECDKDVSCQSVCFKKNLFKNHDIASNDIVLYKPVFDEQQAVVYLNQIPTLLLRPPQ